MKVYRLRLLIIVLYLFLSSVSVYADDQSLDYYDLFNKHGAILLIIDVETGKIEFANIAAQRFYGYAEETIESMTIQEINTLTPEEIARERIAAAVEERNHFIFKHRIASGEIRTVEVFSYPYIVDNQTLLFLIINDITPAVQLAEKKAALSAYYNKALLLLVSFLVMLSAKLYSTVKKYKKDQILLLESERKNSTIVSNIQGMVYKCKFDEHWTMEYISDGCLELTGYKADELLNNAVISFNSIIVEDFRTGLREHWLRAIEQKTIFAQEYLITAKDGTEKWVLERGQIIYTEDGKISALEGIITDITYLKTKERQAREYHEKLHATLISVGDGVITTDRKGKIELINPVTQHLTGWSQEDAFGEDFDLVFNIINEYTRSMTESPVKKVFETEAIVELANHTLLISRDGKETPIEDTAAPIRDIEGNLIGSVIIFRDNSEKHKKKKEIEYISYHDYLTGLFNRRFFEEELNRLDCKRNYPISLVLLDVNGLKMFNDAFGHAIGDELIKKVAKVLVDKCRQDDIVARYGGDEFAIILPNADEADVEKLVKRILQAIGKEKMMNLEISVSFGWDTKYNEGQSLINVINSAENYMYQKKILENLSKRGLVIKSILNTLLVKNPREELHSKRVSIFCEKIGIAYNLSMDAVKNLKAAGELHDIGKIAIDESILNKTESLTEGEWLEIKKHPETGYRILATSSEFANLALAIFSHHERWDGKGYPKGLQGEEIPFEARVIAIADAYDAMISDRPYHQALSEEDAAEEIKMNAGVQFDPDIVQVFLEKVLSRESMMKKHA